MLVGWVPLNPNCYKKQGPECYFVFFFVFSVSDVTDSGLASEAEKKQLVIDSIHITDDLPSHPLPHHPVQSGPALGRPSLCQVFVWKVEKLPRRNLIDKYTQTPTHTQRGIK